VGGVTANTVDKSKGLLICARAAVPHFRRGEAQVSDVKSVTPSTLLRPGAHPLPLASMSGRPVDQLPLLSAAVGGPVAGNGLGASACEAMLRGLNITDARDLGGSHA